MASFETSFACLFSLLQKEGRDQEQNSSGDDIENNHTQFAYGFSIQFVRQLFVNFHAHHTD